MNCIQVLILASSIFAGCSGALPCIKRSVGEDSFICVCNTTYCDTIESFEEDDIQNGSYVHYETNMEEKRLYFMKRYFTKEKKTNFSRMESSWSIVKFTIKPQVKYQEIFGFGGAITDSVGILLSNVSKDMKDKILRLYFGDEGLRYTFIRIPIGASDFSTHLYTYDDNGTGLSLSTFSLTEEDHNFKIPYLKQANNLSSLPLKIIASPWAAPKRMTEPRISIFYKMLRLKDDYYQTYAEYFIRFLEEYEKEGIKIWGLTTENEPLINFFTDLYPVSLTWTPKEEGKWIGNYMGPLLHSKGKDVKIIIYDENRTKHLTLPWLSIVNKYGGKYVSGIAVHSYSHKSVPVSVLSKCHKVFPDLFILSTEYSIRPLFPMIAVRYGRWQDLQDYVIDISEDMNNWVSGWLDWNIILNEEGGPNFLHNNVDSPIIVNTKTEEFYKQPMWYGIAHFSRFVSPGSRRIKLETSRAKGINSNAFITPENTVVLVLLNKKNQSTEAVINVGGGEYININLSPKSLHTVLYKL